MGFIGIDEQGAGSIFCPLRWHAARPFAHAFVWADAGSASGLSPRHIFVTRKNRGRKPYAFAQSSQCECGDTRQVNRACSKISNLRLVGEWLSLVEHLVRDQGVGGSNPLSPTIQQLTVGFLQI